MLRENISLAEYFMRWYISTLSVLETFEPRSYADLNFELNTEETKTKKGANQGTFILFTYR